MTCRGTQLSPRANTPSVVRVRTSGPELRAIFLCTYYRYDIFFIYIYIYLFLLYTRVFQRYPCFKICELRKPTRGWSPKMMVAHFYFFTELQFQRVSTGFSGFWAGSSGFQCVLLSLSGFYWVSVGFCGFQRVSAGFSGFQRVSAGFSGV